MAPSSDFSALVVDDHPLVARAMADYLRLHCGFGRVEAISCETELWANIREFGAPSLALLDFWLPGGTALPLLTRLRGEFPEIRLLVISGEVPTEAAKKKAEDLAKRTQGITKVANHIKVVAPPPGAETPAPF